MNTDQQPETGTARDPLPELSDERVEHIESALFTEIARERTVHRKRRTTVWLVSGAAAAVIVVAAVIAPSVGGLISPTATNESAVAPSTPFADSAGGGSAESGAVSEDLATDATGDKLAAPGDSTAARDIITTASATVVVDDIAAAVTEITDAAESRDGYVESMSIGQSGQVMPVDPMTGMVYDSTMPYPTTPDGAWITVRVPADGLQ